ncbi:MAG: nickel-dependent hydrogenase large subunit [Phycisphaerae bacterium]|nr:nickel-dependent hydrogenase large subunit [Phycisphaerae bacterium]
MSNTIAINPLTRIEGHLSVHAETEPVTTGDKKGFRVSEARCEGEMFRGIETILEGRDPLDAQQITQRICGVCPISHGIASVRAQEAAYGIVPNKNGRLLQNLIFAANFLQSHILHFYHLAALDFVDVKAILKYDGGDRTLRSLKAWVEKSIARKEIFPAAPFLPRYEVGYVKDLDENMALLSHYVEALEQRKICHEMGAVFGARLPHSTALVPGGCTQVPTMERILSYESRLKTVARFVDEVYLPDLLRVAKAFPEYFDLGRGCGDFLSYGAFEMNQAGDRFIKPGVLIGGKWQPLALDRIGEDVAYSRFDQASGLHPSKGKTTPAPRKSGAYSWIKAPRYGGRPLEVGPLARVLANYHDPSGTWIRTEVDAVLGSLQLAPEKLISVLGRHLARGLEAKWIAGQAFKWLAEIDVDAPPAQDFTIPESGAGVGLTEAPRGALGHWLTIQDYRIKRYQCVVPTTWNCSPRDDRKQPGPVEQALHGTIVEDPAQPIEVARIVRSFDPCLACAVH